MGVSEFSTPTMADFGGTRDPHPVWSTKGRRLSGIPYVRESAFLTLHADYIGGQNAIWPDPNDAVGQAQNHSLRQFGSTKSSKKSLAKGPSVKSLSTATEQWPQARNNMSQYDRM